MRKTEKRMSEPKEYTATVSRNCDLCGKAAHDPGDDPEWGLGYDVKQVRVEYKVGESYPEITDTTTHFADICPDCFKGKLVPWLESQGVVMQKEQNNY